MPQPRSKKRRVFRDGRVHVMAERCSTCIFRPGNLMSLERGVVKELVDGADKNGGHIPCHKTLDGKHAICRGYYDRGSSTPLRLAQVMGVVEFVTEGECLGKGQAK